MNNYTNTTRIPLTDGCYGEHSRCCMSHSFRLKLCPEPACGGPALNVFGHLHRMAGMRIHCLFSFANIINDRLPTKAIIAPSQCNVTCKARLYQSQHALGC